MKFLGRWALGTIFAVAALGVLFVLANGFYLLMDFVGDRFGMAAALGVPALLLAAGFGVIFALAQRDS